MGYTLLKSALEDHKIPTKELENIALSEFKKPYLENYPDFNFSLSYSKNLSLCAISQGLEIGIDVEKIEKIEIEDFKSVFSTHIWEKIIQSESPLISFYQYWTTIEAVTKANGDGIVGPIQDIEFNEQKIKYNNKMWLVEEIKEIDNDYKIHLCYPIISNITICYKRILNLKSV